VDALMCCLQSAVTDYGSAILSIVDAVGSGRASPSRLRMAKIIEFYRPSNLRKGTQTTPQERGKVTTVRPA
jgi:hypothetical protein